MSLRNNKSWQCYMRHVVSMYWLIRFEISAKAVPFISCIKLLMPYMTIVIELVRIEVCIWMTTLRPMLKMDDHNIVFWKVLQRDLVAKIPHHLKNILQWVEVRHRPKIDFIYCYLILSYLHHFQFELLWWSYHATACYRRNNGRNRELCSKWFGRDSQYVGSNKTIDQKCWFLWILSWYQQIQNFEWRAQTHYRAQGACSKNYQGRKHTMLRY